MPRRAGPRGVDVLRKDIASQLDDAIRDETDDHRMEELLDSKDKVETCSLTRLAYICNEVLAWDSLSFLDLIGVENDGDIRAEPTRNGWGQLHFLNGEPFTYPLNNWST